jgi:DNA repair protein RecO (recombination protein O)
MAAPHLYRTEAIVLKRSDLGETDKILTLYTPLRGKIRAIAKGVRRPSSRLGGHVELFVHSQMLLARARNLDIITQSETIHSYIPLRDDLWRTTYAYYAAELLDKMTPDHLENQPLFELTLDTLQRLSEDRNAEIAIRYFEVQLLDQLGYRPELIHCVHCRQPLTAVNSFFSAVHGGVLCPECGRTDPTSRPLSLPAFKLLRVLLTGDYALASRVRLEEPLRGELENALRSYIQFVLDHELKSTGVLNSLRLSSTKPTPPTQSSAS